MIPSASTLASTRCQLFRSARTIQVRLIAVDADGASLREGRGEGDSELFGMVTGESALEVYERVLPEARETFRVRPLGEKHA